MAQRAGKANGNLFFDGGGGIRSSLQRPQRGVLPSSVWGWVKGGSLLYTARRSSSRNSEDGAVGPSPEAFTGRILPETGTVRS